MKNLNKRIKNAIIQGFVFNVLISVVFLIIALVYVVPNFFEIHAKKQELQTTSTNLKRIEKSGISFDEYKTLAQPKYGKDTYLKSIFKELTEKFYNSNFINTADANFDVFIKQKYQTVLDTKKSEEYTNREQTLSEILPFYGDSL